MRVELFPQAGVRFPGRRQQWYVRTIAGNGETLSVSEAFASRWNARRHARKFYPDLEIKEVPS